MITRLRTRAFLSCFLPFALLLGCGFGTAHWTIRSIIRTGLRTSLRTSQRELAASSAAAELQNSRFLKIAGENSSLKAGMQLLLANPRSESARRTVEDQLRELGEHMGFDLLLVSGSNGAPLAAVGRQAGGAASGTSELIPLQADPQRWQRMGLQMLHGSMVQTASVGIDENDDSIGTLTVGEILHLSQVRFPAVLVQSGHVIESNLHGVDLRELDRAVAPCMSRLDCDLRLKSKTWIAMPVETYGGGYALLSLQNVDDATAPILMPLDRLFLLLAPLSLLVALLSSFLSSHSVERPIASIVANLRKAGETGKLLELGTNASTIREIRELAEFYDRAAISVRTAGENLQQAYFEFVRSLANALDARDPYTAGHSRRVSHLSCAIANAMGEAAEAVEKIRIGALLHDIGKIGIADAVLQKPGRLTDEEFDLIKQHPVIGRRILEDVQGFAPYLAAVELHHENWDGTGYPHGQAGMDTPLEARIIHVADAFDAMTSNRAYRRGMSAEKAISILVENAGTQFDPRIVDTFIQLPDAQLVCGDLEDLIVPEVHRKHAGASA